MQLISSLVLRAAALLPEQLVRRGADAGTYRCQGARHHLHHLPEWGNRTTYEREGTRAMMIERPQHSMSIADNIDRSAPSQPSRGSDKIGGPDALKDLESVQEPSGALESNARLALDHKSIVERRKNRWAGRRRSWH